MTDLSALKEANAARWLRAKLTRNFVAPAKSLVASKPTYQRVEAKTGVPWFVIAVIHEREASQRWDTQLGQGDRLDSVSVHVPAGRGPFQTWEEGAYDALVNCPPYAARNQDWTPGGALTLLETYNGLGYAARGLPSPYLWSGTDRYTKGKYVRDGVFDPELVDIQPGCAALIKTMIALDPTISFSGVKPTPQPEPKPEPTLPTSWWSVLFSILRSIFGKR